MRGRFFTLIEASLNEVRPRQLLPIALISLLLGLSFDLLFYNKLPGISVLIYVLLILGGTAYLVKQSQRLLNSSVYGLVPVILFFSLMVFIRANLFLAVLNCLLIIYLLALMFRLARQPSVRLSQYEIGHYFNPLGKPLIALGREFYQSVVTIMRGRAKLPRSAYAPVIRGLAISLPVLFIFLLLLSSADLVFKTYVDALFRLFDFNLSPETVFRWSLIALVASSFFAAYVLIFTGSTTPAADQAAHKQKIRLGSIESSMLLGSVSLLFFMFVIIQLAYLFGGANQITSHGYSYAEYARKGFFELIAVAAISLYLIWAVKRSLLPSRLQQSVVFKTLSLALIIEVMLIMISAHMRLSLYEEAYGFTTLRLISHLFILWLVGAFVLLAVYIIREQTENRFAHRLFISALAFIAIFNLINPDALIVRQNMNRFNETGKLDTDYLSNLSADAVPAVASYLEHSNQKLQKKGGRYFISAAAIG